jgi:hypothetical protein
MLRKTFFAAALSFLLSATCALAMTYPNEPKDFYGLRWGLAVGELEKGGHRFTLAGEGADRRVASYNCATRSNNLYGTLFDKISYSFFNGRFFLVRATKKGEIANCSQELYSSLVKAHGRPTQQSDNIHRKAVSYLWQGNDTCISLYCDFLRKEAILSFYNNPLYQQWSAQGRRQPSSGRVRERGG